MADLPLDERGYPVPWFVAWIDGKPDFRVADSFKMREAMAGQLCWVCGQRVGRVKTFVIGPMCAVNRVSAEPPCHEECATFSATGCPFLRLPKAQRREANIPDGVHDPAGTMITRNPGVTLLWSTTHYTIFRAQGGHLFRIGDPVGVAWYCEARRATRSEVMNSITSGLPLLEEIADKEGPRARRALDRAAQQAINTLVPVEA